MLSIRNVTKHILNNRDTGISTMKLHKICYFIQGWHMAICDKPMFTEGFEAWKYGPVSAELEEIFHGRSYILPDDENFINIEDNLRTTRRVLWMLSSKSMNRMLPYN